MVGGGVSRLYCHITMVQMILTTDLQPIGNHLQIKGNHLRLLLVMLLLLLLLLYVWG